MVSIKVLLLCCSLRKGATQAPPHPKIGKWHIAKSMFHVIEELNVKNAQTSNQISAPGTIYFVQHKLIKQNFTLPTFPLNDSIRADCVWL